MNSAEHRILELPCGCREDSILGITTHYCQHHEVAQPYYEIDITRANNLISKWGRIAQSIARQCKWRPQGQCLATCQGLAVCNLEGLTLVHGQGRPVKLSQNPEPGT